MTAAARPPREPDDPKCEHGVYRRLACPLCGPGPRVLTQRHANAIRLLVAWWRENTTHRAGPDNGAIASEAADLIAAAVPTDSPASEPREDSGRFEAAAIQCQFKCVLDIPCAERDIGYRSEATGRCEGCGSRIAPDAALPAGPQRDT